MAESYVDESLTNKMNVAKTILQSVDPPVVGKSPSKSTAEILEVFLPTGKSSSKSTNKLQDLPSQLVRQSCYNSETNVQINHILSNLINNETAAHLFNIYLITVKIIQLL